MTRPIADGLRSPPQKSLTDDIDDFFDDLEDHWDDHWDYLDDHYDHWFHDWHHHHYGYFPYFNPFFYKWHPYFHYYNWYHYWFGYYPIYNHYVWPSYVTYQPVYTPSHTTVVYTPTYTEYVEVPAEAPRTLPPNLAKQLDTLGQNQNAVIDLETGARLFKEGNFLAAADSFRKAMAAEPNNAVPKFALAHALFALGDYEYASFLVERGIAILPEWPQVGTSLHELYGNPDDLKEQTIALATYVDSHSTDIEAHFLLGYVEYFTGNLDGAETMMRAVEASEPYRADVTAFLSRIAEIRLELQRQ